MVLEEGLLGGCVCCVRESRSILTISASGCSGVRESPLVAWGGGCMMLLSLGASVVVSNHSSVFTTLESFEGSFVLSCRLFSLSFNPPLAVCRD